MSQKDSNYSITRKHHMVFKLTDLSWSLQLENYCDLKTSKSLVNTIEKFSILDHGVFVGLDQQICKTVEFRIPLYL